MINILNNSNTQSNLIYLRSAYSTFVSNSIDTLEHIFYFLLVYLIVCLTIYKILFTTRPYHLILKKLVNHVKFPQHNRILLVISHPDDECMFFGPTILSLTSRENCELYILCLSKGNFEKQGKIRRNELWESCTSMGIPESNIILINATLLPDDPNVEWKVEAVAKLILNTVESLDIDGIITFDRDGISQHPNHCAIYYATASLCLANLLPKECKIYTLDSINVIRKYISVFDLLCTFLMSTNWFILNWECGSVVRCAMKKHKSQMKWFRWLYIYFSRYMYINSLREINLSDVELEMQIQDSLLLNSFKL